MRIWALISILFICSQASAQQWVRYNGATFKELNGQVEITVSFEVDSGFHIQSDQPLQESLIPTTLELDIPAGISEIHFPPSHTIILQGSEDVLAVFDGTFNVVLKLDVSKIPDTREIPARLCYQACNDVKCFFPRCLETVVANNE